MVITAQCFHVINDDLVTDISYGDNNLLTVVGLTQVHETLAVRDRDLDQDVLQGFLFTLGKLDTSTWSLETFSKALAFMIRKG